MRIKNKSKNIKQEQLWRTLAYLHARTLLWFCHQQTAELIIVSYLKNKKNSLPRFSKCWIIIRVVI